MNKKSDASIASLFLFILDRRCETNEAEDLTTEQKRVLRAIVEAETALQEAP